MELMVEIIAEGPDKGKRGEIVRPPDDGRTIVRFAERHGDNNFRDQTFDVEDYKFINPLKFKIRFAQLLAFKEGLGFGLIISWDDKLKGIDFFFGVWSLRIGMMTDQEPTLVP